MRDDAEKPTPQKPDHSKSGMDICLEVMNAVLDRDPDRFALAFAKWLRLKRLSVSDEARDTLERSLTRRS